MTPWKWSCLGVVLFAALACSDRVREVTGEPEDVWVEHRDGSTGADDDAPGEVFGQDNGTASALWEAVAPRDECVVVVERVELNGVGNPVMRVFRTYDDGGHLLADGQDWGANGDLDVLYQRTYSAEGLYLDETQDCELDHVIDRRKRYLYDQDGVLRAREWDTLDDGELEQLVTYGYDDAGQRIRMDVDASADGTLDWQVLVDYDDAGNRVREVTYDLGADTVVQVVTRDFDEHANAVEIVTDEDDDGSIEERLVLFYDASGNRVRVERTYPDGHVDWFDYTYSPEGNVLSEEWGGYARDVHWWKHWTYASSCGDAIPAEVLAKIRLQGEGPDHEHFLCCG